jgi:hypothetical protein
MKATMLISTLEDNIYYNAIGEWFFSDKQLTLPCKAIISDDTVDVTMLEEIIPDQPLVLCTWKIKRIERVI